MFEKYFKDYRAFLAIVMLLLSWFWVSSFMNLSKESMPEINLPIYNITAVYPGADSDTIEKQVIQKIEDKVSSVKNVSSYSSVSSTNVWVINIEFSRWTDKWTAYNDLVSAVDEARADMPSGVSNVMVKKADPNDIPIYVFSITWNKYPSELYDKVRYMEDDIKKIPWVDKVIILGKYTYQVEVNFDYEKLKKYNLSLQQLAWIISQNVSQTPADKKSLNGNLYTFEARTYDNTGKNTKEKLEWFQKSLSEMSLININGNILRLKDVASIKVTHPFYQRTSYINWENAVKFMVYKVPGSDILWVIERVWEYLEWNEEKFKENWLKSIEIYSEETEIEKTFSAFLDWTRDTWILILIIATIFLWFRWAFAITVTFPFVYLLTFIMLSHYWYTFNSIVSWALNLSLWIMVDNLIVVAQWFQEWLRKKMWKYEALSYAVKIYFKPLIIWNLVTIAVFFPLSFMLTGKIWEFIKFLPTTVILTLLFSVVVAFVFLPLVLSFINFKTWDDKEENKLEHFFGRFEKPFERFYRKVLKAPYLLIIFFYSLFGLTMFAFSQFWNVDFMPMTDKNNVYINITYNKNISLEENKKNTSKMYEYVKEYFKENHKWVVENYDINLWVHYSMSSLDNIVYNTSFNPDLAEINVVLTKTSERESEDSAIKIYPDLNKFLEEKVSKDEELKNSLTDYSVFLQKNWLSCWKDVTFNLVLSWSKVDDEMNILAWEYDKLLPELKKIPGTYGWSSSLEYTNGKVKVIYDLDKVSQLNLSVPELNAFLFSIYQKWDDTNFLTDYKWIWATITNLNDFWKDVIPLKWYIDYKYDNGKNINFSDLMIPGSNIYFSEVVKSIQVVPQIKTFQHVDWTLVVNVQANKKPDASLWNIQKQVDEISKKTSKVKVVYGADIKDMAQSWQDLVLAFIVWFVLMFSVFVFNFKNLKQPIVLMLTIPLFLIWAILFLLISWESLSMMVWIWLFGLIWVWLAHIIYLVNRFNDLLEHPEGFQTIDEIIINSVKSRLEPVFLTTIITALWLFVLAFSDDFWTAFALSFAGWLIIGTSITLLFIPSAMKILYRNYKINN